jgi:group I intron endonuclease
MILIIKKKFSMGVASFNIYHMMIIYKTTNLVNGKFYIGQDSHNNPEYLGSGLLLMKAIDKYGKENFKKDIIEYCDSKEILNEREIFWIKELKSQERAVGYNIANGGEGGDTISNHPDKLLIGKRHSEKMKSDNYNVRKGKKFGKLSEETKEKIRNKLLGTSWGVHTDESKSKISEKAKGRETSEETKEKIRNKLLGTSWGNHTEESIKLMSFLKIGDKNPMYGKTHTYEVKEMLSEINKHPKTEDTKNKISISLKEYYNNGNKPTNTKKIFINGDVYNGYTEASNATGLTISQIRTRLKSEKYPNYYHVD